MKIHRAWRTAVLEQISVPRRLTLPSPPALRGRRAGDEGDKHEETRQNAYPICTLNRPSPPTPGPRNGARGASVIGYLLDKSFQVFISPG